ncbi:histidinol-phosphate transaminase [Candidatus Micrarchaeota archaeon]|nr:histidinol-phosphate transaminase [Candidatus Micrarchaeota archaeon]
MNENKVRKEVKGLSPYVCARDLYKQADVLLDANENPFGSPISLMGISLNRYPDPESTELRKELSNYANVGFKKMIVGNGSDEIISLAMGTFAQKGDNVITLQPGYSMYDVCAQIAGVEARRVNLSQNFGLDIPAILEAFDERTRLVMFPSPNSVTGTPIPEVQVRKLLSGLDCMVFLDEAYFEFYGKTCVPLVDEFQNLIVSRTLSKAWGLAGLRVGYAISNEENIQGMRRIKPPYNLNCISQSIAAEAVRKNREFVKESVRMVKGERERLSENLKKLGLFAFPSAANFVLVRFSNGTDSKEVQQKLAQKSIIVRDRSSLPMVANCIRITVGTPGENDLVVEELEKIMWKKEPGMTAEKPLEGLLVASDLDGTVTPDDSIFKLFEKYGLAQEAKVLDAKERSSDVKLLLDRIVKGEGISTADLAGVADECSLFEGAPGFYSRLEGLGARICLLTTTYEPIAARMAFRLGIKKPEIIATKVKVENRQVTGFRGPLMEGEEKKKALTELAASSGMPLSRAVGLGDSEGDAPFMDAIAATGGECFWISKPDFPVIERKILQKFRR